MNATHCILRFFVSKQNLLFFLFLFISQGIFAQIVNIPDQNFKSFLLKKYDTNGSGNIEVSEIENVTSLEIDNNDLPIESIEGIEAFESISNITITSQLKEIKINGLQKLEVINVSNNPITNVELRNLPRFTSAFIIRCQVNSIQLSNLPNLEYLNCSHNEIQQLNLEPIGNKGKFEFIDCSYNQIKQLNLDVTEAQSSLITLNCSHNELSTLGYQSFTNLKYLRCESNSLTKIDLSNHLDIKVLDCDTNNITQLIIPNSDQLVNLSFASNDLPDFKVPNLPELYALDCSETGLLNLDIQHLNKLRFLKCSHNELSEVDLSAFDIRQLHCQNNKISELDLSNSPQLTDLNCGFNLIDSIHLANNRELKLLHCPNNNLSSLILSQNFQLEEIFCQVNNLDTIILPNQALSLGKIRAWRNNLRNVTGLSKFPKLAELSVPFNNIKSFKPVNRNLINIGIGDNGLEELDLSGVPALTYLDCKGNLIKELDLSQHCELKYTFCHNNPELEFIYMKNGNGDNKQLNIEGNVKLKYICGDHDEIKAIQRIINNANLKTHTNTFCSFVPGKIHANVKSEIVFDENKDGCTEEDSNLDKGRYEIRNTDDQYSGPYSELGSELNVRLPWGEDYILKPQINEQYYNVTPQQDSFSLLDDMEFDYCVTSKGIFNDLSVVIIPIGRTRPGFSSRYKIIYRNKGTTRLSGQVTFNYPGQVMTLTEASEPVTSREINNLSWDYFDLKPFEERVIDLKFLLNKPTDEPSLVGGEILDLKARIFPILNESNRTDNFFFHPDPVVNSYDPNDKTCLQGNTIRDTMVGAFLDYLIRFENTGTAEAIHVVVKDTIDSDKFLINTLTITDASHPLKVRTSYSNNVDFIFENINLPFDDANNDGYVAFKIQTKDDLIVGDEIENKAEIYFDFNFPIITNNEVVQIVDSTFFNQNFSKHELFANLYPNPTRDFVTIDANLEIEEVKVFDDFGRLIKQAHFLDGKKKFQLSTRDLGEGIYFIKMFSEYNYLTKKLSVFKP